MKKLAVVAVAVVLASCGQAGDRPEDATPTRVDDSTPIRENAFAKGQDVDIEWQTTTADIEPTSRFRDPIGGSDTATISTSMLLSEAADDDTKSFFEGLEGVETEIDESGRLVHMTYRVEVSEDTEQDDRYRLEIAMPHEFADLRKDGDVGLTVLLPRPAKGYAEESGYDVRLEPPDDDAAEVFEPDEESQRISVHFYNRQDPVWDVIYDLFG
jgi:hypothetical protein